MNFFAALRSALRALAANTLRSILTMLGIIIGVAAVITMIAVGSGATERVQAQMKGLGSNIMLVLPGGVSQAGVRLGAQTRQRLTEEDALAISIEIAEVQVAAPTTRTSGQVVGGNTNWGTTIFGVNNDYLEARDWSLVSGRLFDPAELAGSAKVAWMGQTVAREIFGEQDPVDQVVRVRGVPMKIIGVLAKKGQNSMGQDQDDALMIPISTLRSPPPLPSHHSPPSFLSPIIPLVRPSPTQTPCVFYEHVWSRVLTRTRHSEHGRYALSVGCITLNRAYQHLHSHQSCIVHSGTV